MSNDVLAANELRVEGIVKVQRPLYGHPSVLIYNEDKTICKQWPYTEALKEDLDEVMGDSLKAYFYAESIPDPEWGGRTLLLGDIAPEQEW